MGLINYWATSPACSIGVGSKPVCARSRGCNKCVTIRIRFNLHLTNHRLKMMWTAEIYKYKWKYDRRSGNYNLSNCKLTRKHFGTLSEFGPMASMLGPYIGSRQNLLSWGMKHRMKMMWTAGKSGKQLLRDDSCKNYETVGYTCVKYQTKLLVLHVKYPWSN